MVRTLCMTCSCSLAANRTETSVVGGIASKVQTPGSAMAEVGDEDAEASNVGNLQLGYRTPWHRGVNMAPWAVMSASQSQQASLLEHTARGIDTDLERFSH